MRQKQLLGKDLSTAFADAEPTFPLPAVRQPVAVALRKSFELMFEGQDVPMLPGEDVTDMWDVFVTGIDTALIMLQTTYGMQEIVKALDEMAESTCIIGDDGVPECK